MKIRKLSVPAILFFCLMLAGCEADNMDAPYCHVQGKMCYQGQSIGVRGSGSNQLTPTVQIELWQAGFGKEAAQNVSVAQDGTFSTYIYPGEVRIITKSGVGPWKQGDTLRTIVNGNVNLDYEVLPYFIISNVNYDFDSSSKVLTASFHVTKVVEDAKIKSMGLLVNNTQFVDMTYYKASKVGGGQEGDVSFSLDCSSLVDLHSLYARVFVGSDKSSYETFSTTPFKVW